MEFVQFGNGVSAVGDRCCALMEGLTSVVFPDSLKSIGNYAFYGTSLTSVDLPDALWDLGRRSFAFSGLRTVNIPSWLDVI